MSFSGRTALVTGAGRGIGAAIAAALAERGARIAINDVDAATAASVAEQLHAQGAEAAAFAADITLEPEVAAMCERIVGAFGSLDILVNNAGVLGIGPTETLAADAWARTLAVNLTGAFYCCKAALPGMKARRYGKIVNVASLAGESGGILAGADYAASKGGLLALTRKLALEAAPFGINVNAVAPGTTDTAMLEAMTGEDRAVLAERIPLRRLGRPEDVAHAVCFLAGDEASFITGATLDVNGGLLMR